ncbi:MAG: hypothetical protein OXT07_08375 [bacterium]|nr:hypothetical protein [bacterium]
MVADYDISGRDDFAVSTLAANPSKKTGIFEAMNLAWIALTILFFGILAVSCSQNSGNTSACEQAAVAQAHAEEYLGLVINEHIAADQELASDPELEGAQVAHEHSSGPLLDARVNVILAEAETRRSCR